MQRTASGSSCPSSCSAAASSAAVAPGFSVARICCELAASQVLMPDQQASARASIGPATSAYAVVKLQYAVLQKGRGGALGVEGVHVSTGFCNYASSYSSLNISITAVGLVLTSAAGGVAGGVLYKDIKLYISGWDGVQEVGFMVCSCNIGWVGMHACCCCVGALCCRRRLPPFPATRTGLTLPVKQVILFFAGCAFSTTGVGLQGALANAPS